MSRESIGETSEIEPGKARSFQVGEKRIAVCNVDGTFYAINDVCTHDGAPLDQGVLEGNIITCPRHGAKFDVTTGTAVQMPAVIPVETYQVEIEDDTIYLITDEE
ncbi:non-heme iron oxygenase ferredoxin subunit [Candidatus Marinimicrobia bacterium MT.SAG.3]|nr:non-heme iron oxygenase ferredoxin subunit [Candidatus Marinimicrobia bacterium MT.SAG.3]TFB12729.1 non-heme iron oxygenase ferredoxin subunit [Candidatus Marinimicrobia bacterium MT.SAG.4]